MGKLDGKVAFVTGAITEEQFDATFSLNARGTLFTVQKAPPLFNDGGSIFMTGSNVSLRGYPDWSVYAASKAALPALARVWVAEPKRLMNTVPPRPGARKADPVGAMSSWTLSTQRSRASSIPRLAGASTGIAVDHRRLLTERARFPVRHRLSSGRQ